MPLPGIDEVRQCTARAKSTESRCRNAAVSKWGLPPTVCRMHGARHSSSIMRGANHPQHKHGQETLEAKAERSQQLSELRELEALSFALGIATGPKWRGRKPARIVAQCSAPPGGTRDTNEGYYSLKVQIGNEFRGRE
jgi:hypothetical protein